MVTESGATLKTSNYRVIAMRHIAITGSKAFGCGACDTSVRECRYCDRCFCMACDITECKARLIKYRVHRRRARFRRYARGTLRIDRIFSFVLSTGVVLT